MFIYLSKKIAIPHGLKLSCVSWNAEEGWIACGGADGLLKVLKLDSKPKPPRQSTPQTNQLASSPSPPSTNAGSGVSGNLSMNQTLEGHTSTVMCTVWNDSYRKLTSSDSNGLIIVWMLHKGLWFEEMINNRNKSVVRDMKWTSDGTRICIVYEDGAVIVGAVDGNRLWGRELETQLTLVEWSPDGRHLLFGTTDSAVHLYDNVGNFISKLNIFAVGPDETATLVGIQWFSGMSVWNGDDIQPTLAIVFDNGRIQIMRDDTDDNPTLIDTAMSVTKAMWNHNGQILAVAGTTVAERDTAQVQFYSPTGQHLRTLRVPGQSISSLSWETGSLRLALAVDSFIYFANVRNDYLWAFFSKTVVYAFPKPDRVETCVIFWDATTDERNVKYVKQLIAIRGAGEHCVFATRTEDGSGQFILILCNAIGSPVDSKYIDVEPIHIAMSATHVVISDGHLVYVWQYKTAVNKLTSISSSAAVSIKRKEVSRERVFHVDDPSATINVAIPADATNYTPPTLDRTQSSDPISAVTASNTVLAIGRSSGSLLRLTLPHLAVDGVNVVECRPYLLSLNSDSRRLSIIDINGTLTLFDLQGGSDKRGSIVQGFERREVWDILWAADNPDMFACMEKTRMYVFRGEHAEEPVLSAAHLCAFSELTITALHMDDVMAEPENPDKSFLLTFETKSLRDTRELLNGVPIEEAVAFIESHPHPRLWRLLAENALAQMNLAVAEKAFVRAIDYQGIQFIKRLKLLTDSTSMKAEISAYFRRFDDAEQMYLAADAKQSAIDLRSRLGDWFRVVQLLNGYGSDAELNHAYVSIGDYYADRQKWAKAYKFYAKGNAQASMIQCAYLLDDFTTLTQLIDQIPVASPLLKSIGDKLSSVGLCHEAVDAYLKAEQPKAAIDCCVMLNEWDTAVKLAEQHKIPQIATLLTKYASHLLNKNKLFQAVELYRKAGRHDDASRLLIDMAQNQLKAHQHPIRAKKLYVMAAMEAELHRASQQGEGIGLADAAQLTQSTIQSLLDNDAKSAAHKTSVNPSAHLGANLWSGVAAVHYYLLCQRLIQNNAYVDAFTVANYLRTFTHIHEPKVVSTLIAYTAYQSGYYGQCSGAMMELESYDDGNTADVDDTRRRHSQLALQIFTRHPPIDPNVVRSVRCANGNGLCDGRIFEYMSGCSQCGDEWGLCMVTGRSLNGLSAHHRWTCRTCNYSADGKHVRMYESCPLCHSRKYD